MKLKRLFTSPLLEPRIKLRDEHNPHLPPSDLLYWWELRSTFNPGTILKDNKFYLLYRAQDFHFYSRFGLAIFDPQINKITYRSDLPVFEFDRLKNSEFARIGCEDPRIITFDNKKFIITCVSATTKPINTNNLSLINESKYYYWYNVSQVLETIATP